MKPVILVHGIRSLNKGLRTMSPLRDVLAARGRAAEIVSYGYVLIPLTNAPAMAAVMRAVKKPAVVVGYSNGAWAAVQAAEMGEPIEHLVLVSPALNRSHAFPEGVKKVDVFYNPDDVPVRLARWWRNITRVLPWRWDNAHGWGDMGRTGYVGKDPRVTNHRLPRNVGHAWFQSPDAIAQVADAVGV
jgi:pimeloyl-ACP methyl ester carboxylesterase